MSGEPGIRQAQLSAEAIAAALAAFNLYSSVAGAAYSAAQHAIVLAENVAPALRTAALLRFAPEALVVEVRRRQPIGLSTFDLLRTAEGLLGVAFAIDPDAWEAVGHTSRTRFPVFDQAIRTRLFGRQLAWPFDGVAEAARPAEIDAPWPAARARLAWLRMLRAATDALRDS